MRSATSSPAPSAAELQRQVLSRAARLLASAADFRDTLRQTIGACLPALADFGFFDVVHGGEVIRTVAAHEAREVEAILAPTRWVRSERKDLNLCALSSGEPALHADITDGWYRRIAADEGQLEVLRRLAFCSMITVPVRYREELVGALTLFMARSGRQHTQEDLDFASELALLAAPVVVNARLVEQHRQAEAALRTSEQRLRMALEAGRVGIWDWDVLTDRIEWSEQIYRLYGLEAGTEPNRLERFADLVHPEDAARVRSSIVDALAGERPYHEEFRTVLSDGSVRWISAQAHVVRDAQGKPLRMVGASTDVTQRMELLAAERAARAEAEAARKRLELLVRAGAALSRSLDPQETLRTIGESIVPAIADWCRIDLLDEQGALQRRLAYHLDAARAQEALELARHLRASPDTVGAMAWVIRTGEAHYGRVDDPDAIADDAMRTFVTRFGMNAHYVIPLVARGRTIGAMAVLQAESGRDLGAGDRALVLELGQRAALALDNARLYSAAEAANRAKDEFLAMLGHELRNPLAPIATALELMSRRQAEAHQEERRIIGRQVAHLSRLIDDLLDVSRITRGKIQLVREPLDLRAVVARALETTRPVYAQHSRGVEVRLDDAPLVVTGDAIRLTQVLCNLLVNAARFTPHDGRVSLSVTRKGDRVEATVEDTGAGIDPRLLPRIFDLFVQGEQPMDRQGGGLGLGLALVRTLTQMHGGSVSAHSDGPGRGARFTVSLPASPGPGGSPDPAPAPEPPSSAGEGAGRILIVDDNADAAQTLSDLLGIMGYDVKFANHAREALPLFRSHRPQVALLDIGLPDIDGYELAGMLRREPEGRAAKLVALTGYGQDNDRARAREVGFDEHMVKPVDIDKLLELLKQMMG